MTTETSAPWLTVVNPAIFLTYCAECGEPFKKGGKVQRINGGYGYRCEKCGTPGNEPSQTSPTREDGTP